MIGEREIMIDVLQVLLPSGILYTWYMAVQDSMYLYEQVRTLLATWRYKKPQNGMYQYVLTHEITRSIRTSM
jgi:hypothetical protein